MYEPVIVFFTKDSSRKSYSSSWVGRYRLSLLLLNLRPIFIHGSVTPPVLDHLLTEDGRESGLSYNSYRTWVGSGVHRRGVVNTTISLPVSRLLTFVHPRSVSITWLLDALEILLGPERQGQRSRPVTLVVMDEINEVSEPYSSFTLWSTLLRNFSNFQERCTFNTKNSNGSDSLHCNM